jgi:hypothetical protein
VPFADAMEKLLPPHAGDVPQPLRLSKANRNDATTAVLLCFTLFVAGHLTKKVLDDVFAIIIQPRLKPLLEKIDLKLARNRADKKSFNASVWYAEFNVLVSVTVVGKSFAEIIEQRDLIPTVHANAISWIAANGVQKPIHHYSIEDGKVNAAPILADHFQDVLR